MRAIRIDLSLFTLAVITPTSRCPVQYLFSKKHFRQAAQIPSKLKNKISLLKRNRNVGSKRLFMAEWNCPRVIQIMLRFYCNILQVIICGNLYLNDGCNCLFCIHFALTGRGSALRFQPPVETVVFITQQCSLKTKMSSSSPPHNADGVAAVFSESLDHIWGFRGHLEFESRETTEVKLFSPCAPACSAGLISSHWSNDGKFGNGGKGDFWWWCESECVAC